MNIRKLGITTLFCLPALVIAHGPTPQKAKESITINVPVDRVWETVKQFDKISEWHSDIKVSKGDGKLESGGSRTVTFQNGEELVDELDFYSEKDHEYSYRIKKENVKAIPVSSYSVTLQVVPGDSQGSSTINLKSRFYRGDTGNTPPDNLNDEVAVKAMTEHFKNGLTSLKQKLEQP
jgi:mxaD protein